MFGGCDVGVQGFGVQIFEGVGLSLFGDEMKMGRTSMAFV